jgi:hypothetical protein
MTDEAAFKATYSGFKFVATRKVAQIVLEVPSEQAMRVLECLGGMPDGANERWCAVAVLR